MSVSALVYSNYYPVNAMISIEDETQQFTVVTDVSQGGSSLESGQLELMVHRRVQQDDHRGVQEPLNETMCGCNDENAAPGQMGENGHEGDGGCDCEGLTMRGRHFIIFDTKEQANLRRRMANEEMQSPATIAINIGTGTPAHSREAVPRGGVDGRPDSHQPTVDGSTQPGAGAVWQGWLPVGQGGCDAVHGRQCCVG